MRLAIGFTIHAFKITHDRIAFGIYGQRSNSTTGLVHLKVLFATAQSKYIKMFLFYQIIDRFEFDKFQNVIDLFEVVSYFALVKLNVWSLTCGWGLLGGCF